MLVTSQFPIQTTKFAVISFQRALVPPHFEKSSEKVPTPMVMYPQNFIFYGADFGSTIAYDLQQKLKHFLHSSQQQMAVRFFIGCYSFFV